MKKSKIKALVEQLTLDEKAGLCSGRDNWFTKAVERLDIPVLRTSDGPHGLRIQEGDVNIPDKSFSMPAVCFPAACATAASFDRELIERMGAELGRECRVLGVHVLLGPGINIKRSPLCGRNFEYFSEDPFLTGELGTAFVNGVQGQGVGVSLKHFFANNQEYRRMESSSELDERTMREIYLAAFEAVIKAAKPWTIMASYNRIGGVYSTQNRRYLIDLLREEWNFEGLVMSDWGATHDRVAAVAAGCALTMPAATDTDHEIVEAVQNGSLEESALDTACEQVLSLAFKATEVHKGGVTFDYDGGHTLAREIAEQSIVLLKNSDGILPLSRDCKAAFIGGFAQAPRYQGGGSSHINSHKVPSALEVAQKEGYVVTYAQGYPIDGVAMDEELIAYAAEVAKAADIAVVFAGLTEDMESEGEDRRHMHMPQSHNVLIEAICAANPNTIVVLHNGAPVEMPWVEKPKAILEAYLGGQAVAEAMINILYGKVNPSGHLPETFPKKLEDNSSYLFYFGEGDVVQYAERFFVGYRYSVSKRVEPLFPFGHGLSYTTFIYTDLMLDKEEITETESVTAQVKVTNVGMVAGKVLVQLYVAPPRMQTIRPVRELKGFEKVNLAPGESATVAFKLYKKAFMHWDEALHDWRVESGKYMIQICENAHKIMLEAPLKVDGRIR